MYLVDPLRIAISSTTLQGTKTLAYIQFKFTSLSSSSLTNTWTERDIAEFCFPSGEIRNNVEILAGKMNISSKYYSRVVTNQLRYGPLSKDFLPVPSPVNFFSENTKRLYEVGINSLAADYLGNDEVNLHIWLWNPHLDVAALALHYREMCVFMEKETGLWNVMHCSYSLRTLCKNNSNSTQYTAGALISNPQLFISPLHVVSIKNYSQIVCPMGYSFQPPTTTLVEIRLLHTRYEVSFAKQLHQQLWIGFLLEDYYFVYICLFTFHSIYFGI